MRGIPALPLVALWACWGDGEEGRDAERRAALASDARSTEEGGGYPLVRTTGPPQISGVAPERSSSVPVVFVNDTDRSVVIDRSFGPLSPFALHAEGSAELLTLDDRDDAQTGGAIATCFCACEDAPCPECEPPRMVQVSLAPGDRYEVLWNQRVRTFDGERECYPRSQPEEGRYSLSACAADGPCVSSEVTLPATRSLELKWSSLLPAPRCEHLDLEAAGRAALAFRGGLNRMLPERSVLSCPGQPRCVEEASLEAAFAGTSNPDCATVVVPQGDRMDVYLYLPLPDGYVGGARYRQTWDLSGRRLLDAQYTQ